MDLNYKGKKSNRVPKRLIIIDSNSLLHRAFHALPLLKTRKGEIVNACYGFSLLLLKGIDVFQPDFVAAAFDSIGPTFRHLKFKEYKATRKKAPDELYLQIPKIKEILSTFKIPIFELKGFEADDLIGTIVSQAEHQAKEESISLEIIILTSDLDMLQLIDNQTKVYALKRGIKEAVLYDERLFEKEYSDIKPSQFIQIKALKGDASDNIPGVPGIGEKTAIDLIKKFGDLDHLYQAITVEERGKEQKILKPRIRELLKKYKDQAFFSKELSTIKRDVALDFNLNRCSFGNYDKNEVVKIFNELEFFALAKKIMPAKESSQVKGQKTILSLKEEEKKEENLVSAQIDKLFQQGVFSSKVYQTEKKLIPVIKEMEETGIKINLKKIRELSDDLQQQITKIKGEIFKKIGREINLNSPKQLSDFLFNELKMPTTKIKKNKNGSFSTNAQELEKISAENPLISQILQYRELTKLKSGFVEALIKAVDKKDGRIHPHFNQLGAETGRIICSSPNLQNIPQKGETAQKIRQCFEAQKGYKLISFDYSQIELKIIAFLAKDEKMLNFFKQGKDVHKLTASAIFLLPEEKITYKQRQLAKTLNYAIIYGVSVHRLAEIANLSFLQAKEFMSRYFAQFKGIREFIDESIQQARENGYAETLFGRKRFLPEINSIDKRVKSHAERVAVNMRIQGTASDIIKMAMVEIWERGILTGELRLLLQIHDELLFEIKQEKAEKSSLEIKKIMENVVDFGIPLAVKIKQGYTWRDLEDMLE